MLKLNRVLILLLIMSSVLLSKEYPKPPAESPVQYDRYSFTVNGERVFIACGEFHYWRCPSKDMWEPILRRFKANGLNAVSIYFHWGFHSPEMGVYDFSGIRDIEYLLDLCEEIGLWVIARPGPYINAETDGGGLPPWLLTSSAEMRANDPGYLCAVEQWFKEVVPIIAKHQMHLGGNVIMFQIENELGDGDLKYMKALYKMTRDLGIIVPIFHNDSIAWLQYADALDVSGHDDYPAWFFCREPWSMEFLAAITDEHEYMYREVYKQTHIPMFEVEYQGGSIDYWGGCGFQCCYDKLGPEFLDASIKSLMGEGTTAINEYMFYGGTSWGYLGYPGVYTSYDYGAPLREWTNLGSRYDASKRVMMFATSTQSVFTKTLRNMNLVKASNPDLLFRVRENPDTKTQFIFLRNMDESKVQQTSLKIRLEDELLNLPVSGQLELDPRETRILTVNYPMQCGQLMTTSSEILTHEKTEALEVLVVYDEPGRTGELSIKLKKGMKVSVLSDKINTVKVNDKVRFEYKHLQKTQHALLKHDKSATLIVITDKPSTAKFWRAPDHKNILLVQGGYLVDENPGENSFHIETISNEMIELVGYDLPESVRINHKTVQLKQDKNFPVSFFQLKKKAKLPKLPDFKRWKINSEPFLAASNFDDSNWIQINERDGMNPDRYGIHHGYIWYRGDFVPTGNETAIEVQAYHSYTIWINGKFVASSDTTGLASFPLSDHILKTGEKNQIALLVESLGHDQGGEQSKRQIGLWTVQFTSDEKSLRPKRYSVKSEKMFTLEGDWHVRSKELFYGGGGYESAQKGDKISFEFRGPDLTIWGATGPDHGKADVIIDGNKAGEIDAYVKWIPGQKPKLFHIHGWGDGPHKAEIIIKADHNKKSSGNRVTIDAITAASKQPAVLPVKIDWKIQGDNYTDDEKGSFNTSGLYGERNEWYEPDFDDSQWKTVNVPHTFEEKDQWITWYRTEFDLNLPESLNAPLGLVMDGVENPQIKAVIFVNGYLLGRYWPDKGPQTKFYLYPGILNEHGKNKVAIAVWRRSPAGGRLGNVYLEPWTVTEKFRVEF